MDSIKELIETELKRAKELHPEWTGSRADQLAVIMEEVGELAKAIQEGTNDIEEAAHVVVTAIRYIEIFSKK